MAVFVSDHLAKTFLLQMLEWNAAGRTGEASDVWYNGRFLEHWADERVLRRLGDAFPRYDERDIWRALQGTLDVFSMVAREAASRLSRSYLDRAETKTRDWIAVRMMKADAAAEP
jgi:aminoglycoside 6-adenylyltransferase